MEYFRHILKRHGPEVSAKGQNIISRMRDNIDYRQAAPAKPRLPAGRLKGDRCGE